MPVIQLPKDTRWGDLGAGLGNVLGSVLNAYQDKQTVAGVAEIMQDPSVSQTDKPSKILKQFGDKGYEHYKKLIQTQVFESQIKEHLAGVGLKNVETEIKQKQLPTTEAQAQANVAKTQAGTQLEATQAANIAALTGPEVAAKTAQAASTSADAATKQALLPGAEAAQSALTQERRQSAGRTAVEIDILQQQADARRSFGASGESGLDAALKPFNLKPDEIAGAKEVYKSNEVQKAGSGYDKMIDYAVKRQTEASKRSEVKPAPTEEVKTASNDAAHAVSAQRFMKEFTSGGAQRIGSLKGAPLIAKLEQWGIATGDDQIVKMINSAKQQIQATATTGSGYIGKERIKLAGDVTPGVLETPIHALAAMDEVAERKIAELTNRLSGYEGTQINVKPYENALAAWREVKQTTGSLNSYVKPDPRFPNDPTKGTTVMFFEGSQIDPKTFKQYITNDATEYPLPGGETRPGTWFFEASKPPEGPDDKFHKNIDPWTLYKMLNPRAVPFTDRRGAR